MKKVGVACGGYTSEREISLKSGSFIFNLICDANFESLIKLNITLPLLREIFLSEVNPPQATPTFFIYKQS